MTRLASNHGAVEDFLDESGALLDALDEDVASLAEAPSRGPIDRAFRAVHTVKGSASFLGYDAITELAHAAEDALGAVREREAELSRSTLSLLAESAAGLRRQLGALARGDEPDRGPEAVIASLRSLGRRAAPDAPPAPPAATRPAAPFGATMRRLELGPDRAEIAPHMASDLLESANALRPLIDELERPGARPGAAARVAEIGADVRATTDFFDFDQLRRLADALARAGRRAPDLSDDARREVVARLRGVRLLIEAAAEAIRAGWLPLWPTDTLERRLADLLDGDGFDPAWAAGAREPVATLAVDGIGVRPAAPGVDDETVRVAADRLDALSPVASGLRDAAARAAALAERLLDTGADAGSTGAARSLSDDLASLAAEAGARIDRARSRPIAGLFDRGRRAALESARALGKDVAVVIEGASIDVDSRVHGAIGAAITHAVRNAVAHGVEPGAERARAGKPERATVRLRASIDGGDTEVTVEDDGAGVDRARVLDKAIERGLLTAGDAPRLSDEGVLGLLFAPGFSTAGEVGEHAGRGVGLDAARASIEAVGGSVGLSSEPGAGVTVRIRVPGGATGPGTPNGAGEP